MQPRSQPHAGSTTAGSAGDAIVDPHLPLVDAHHHLWVHDGKRYLVEEFASDIASGHDVRATVYVECSAMYRRDGPEHLRPVGEAEFVAGMAAMSDSGQFGPARICAAFIGSADLRLGAAVDEVLDAMAVASGGRLRGIRGLGTWDEDPSINTGIRGYGPRDLLLDPRMHEGVRRLGQRGLVYEAWQYHPQLGQLCTLADACPDTPIVVSHCGGLLGIGRYATPDTYPHWKSLVTELARRPNVLMKLGGLSARRCGFDFQAWPEPPTQHDLARTWHPYVQTCIELFGPQRCLYESNFPPDRVAGSYRTVWNALKLTAAGYSDDEKRRMYHDNAARLYRIE